jgi:hypothetical protein
MFFIISSIICSIFCHASEYSNQGELHFAELAYYSRQHGYLLKKYAEAIKPMDVFQQTSLTCILDEEEISFGKDGLAVNKKSPKHEPAFLKNQQDQEKIIVALHPSQGWSVTSKNGPSEYTVKNFLSQKTLLHFKDSDDETCYWGIKMFLTDHFLVTICNQRKIIISDLFTGTVLSCFTLHAVQKVQDCVQYKNKFAIVQQLDQATNDNNKKKAVVRILDLTAFENIWNVTFAKWQQAEEKLKRLLAESPAEEFPASSTSISTMLKPIDLDPASQSL